MAVRRSFPNISDHEIEEAVRVTLHDATDRDGGRKRRQGIKRESQVKSLDQAVQEASDPISTKKGRRLLSISDSESNSE